MGAGEKCPIPWMHFAASIFAAVLGVLSTTPAFAQERGAYVRVGGDVVVAEGERSGPIVVVGGSVVVNGSAEAVVAIGGPVTVAGEVRDTLVAIGGPVRLAPGATVRGDVVLVGGALERDPGTVIGGELTEVGFARGIWIDGTGFQFAFWRDRSPVLTLLYVVGLFLTALLVVTLWPRHVAEVSRTMAKNPTRSVLFGLFAALLLAPLSLLLLVTIVGPPLLWLFYGVVKIMGYAATVLLVGDRVSERVAPRASSGVRVGIGVVVVAFLRFIPVLGWFVSVGITLWSTGAVLDSRFGSNRPWLPPRKA